MNKTLILRYAACILGGGLVLLAGFETPLDYWDMLLLPAGAWLVGWAGFKRPGDAGK